MKKLWNLLVAVALLCLLSATRASAQFYALKLNALAFATGTVNAGIDFALSDHLSFDLSAYWNPIRTQNVRMRLIAVQPGIRYWLYQPHVGTFLGTHPGFARYEIGGDEHRNRGTLTGIGFSVGHAWLLSKRWNFSLEAGAGLYYLWNTHGKYFTSWDSDEVFRHARRLVFAPSKAEISFSYLF